MIALLFIIGFIAYAFGDGFSDGRFKLLCTEAHWTKWPPRIGVGLMLLVVWIQPPSLWVLAEIVAFKPLFDMGWAKGNKQKGLFIGKSDWTDRLLHRIGAVKLEVKSFPLLTILYLGLIFAAIIAIFESYKTKKIMARPKKPPVKR